MPPKISKKSASAKRKLEMSKDESDNGRKRQSTSQGEISNGDAMAAMTASPRDQNKQNKQTASTTRNRVSNHIKARQLSSKNNNATICDRRKVNRMVRNQIQQSGSRSRPESKQLKQLTK